MEHGWLNKLHNEIIYFNQGTIDVFINYTQCNSNDAKLLAQQSTRLQLTDLQLIFTDLQLNLVIWRASNTIYCESCVFSSYSWLTGLLRLLYLFINRLTDELDSSVRADGRCTADHWWWVQPQSCQHSHTLAVLHSAHVTSTVSAAAAARIITIIIKSILTSPLLQS